MYTLRNRCSPRIDHEQKNSYIVLYMWGWSVHYKVLTSASTMVHLLMASKSSSLPPFLHHCTAVVDMTVVTAKNRLRLIYLDTEQHLFSDLPYWFSVEIILVSRLIRRGKVSQPPSPLCSCSVRSIVASSSFLL